MNLGNCTFTPSGTGIIENLVCEFGHYTGNDKVYRAGFLGEDGAYYISQNLLFSVLIWFWSIFFVSFTIIALGIKSFKLGLKK